MKALTDFFLMFQGVSRYITAVFFLCFLFPTYSYAQTSPSTQASSFSFSSQIRYRGEIDGRFFNLDAKPLFFNLLRARFGATMIANEDVSAFIQIQHSQNFGENNEQAWNGTLDGMSKNLTFREAYLLWNNALIDHVTLKLGRMAFSTNSERLIGALEWHNIARMYDGAVIKYAPSNDVQIRGFGFVLGNNELMMTAASQQSPQALTGIDVTLPTMYNLNAYLYHDRKNIQQTTAAFQNDAATFRRFTTGLFTQQYLKESSIEYELEFAYQFGTKDILPTQSANIKAMMAAAYVGYKNSDWTAGVGFDYLTGEDASTTNTTERFNNLTFTIHKFYGYMDFFPFTVLPNNNTRQAPPAITANGLVSPYIKSTYKPNDKTSLYLAGHYFQSQQEVKTQTGTLVGNNLGIEIDAVIDHKVSQQLSAQLGASIFLPGETIKKTNTGILGDDISYWAYSMLTFTL